MVLKPCSLRKCPTHPVPAATSSTLKVGLSASGTSEASLEATRCGVMYERAERAFSY